MPKKTLYRHRVAAEIIPCPKKTLYRHRFAGKVIPCQKKILYRHRIARQRKFGAQKGRFLQKIDIK